MFVGGQLIGGADELLATINEGTLSKLLEQAAGKPALPKELQDAVDSSITSFKVQIKAG